MVNMPKMLFEDPIVRFAIQDRRCNVDDSEVKTGLFTTTRVYRAKCFGCDYVGPERFGSYSAAKSDADAHNKRYKHKK